MMTVSKIVIYVAESGFAGILFTITGFVSRTIWDLRRGQ